MARYVSVIPSLTITPPPPPRRHPGICMFSLPGGSAIRPIFFAPGDWGYELEKFSTVLKEKCKNFSIGFIETGGSLKSRCSCAVSYQYLQKQ